MKHFEDFFTDNNIIFLLCKIRVKCAKQRNKKHLIHLLTSDERYNYHVNQSKNISEYDKQLQADLNKLMPHRKKWKKLGEQSRYKKGSRQKLNSIDKNLYSLLKTINYYRVNEPNEDFVINLNNFINEIRESIKDPKFSLVIPTIYPKLKEKKFLWGQKEKENICRPISLFQLKDRIILSLTNKYFTLLFDASFTDNSLAFRSVQNFNGKSEFISHHSAIKKIIDYKTNHRDEIIWVAECDMKKFYDTVNHRIIIKYFNSLIKRAKNDFPNHDVTIPCKIFKAYLKCYCFNENVLKYNKDKSYWDSFKIPQGQFGWVLSDFIENHYYNEFKTWNFKGFLFNLKILLFSIFSNCKILDIERIGIPQGGALSGLIANIVLNTVDNKVIGDSQLLYLRFCDDMILMHPIKESCLKSITKYQNEIKRLKLIPHKFCQEENLRKSRQIHNIILPSMTIAPFWEEKSKGPYKWDAPNNGGFPWVGFVGYEIHYKGYVRVRKSSLKKELKKQKEVIYQILNSIKNQKRVTNGTIIESAIHRLIGMSVGRVELWNFSTIENELCWINGFKELNINKYSIKQAKQLDRSRNKLYFKLIKDLEKDYPDDEVESPTKPKSRQIVDYNQPFSYYYHIVKKAL